MNARRRGTRDKEHTVVRPSLVMKTAGDDEVNVHGLRRALLLAFGSPSATVEIHDPDEARGLLRDVCVRYAESSHTLLDLATTPRASLDDLRFVKALAERLVKTAMSSREAEAARLLYHVADAAAIGRFHVGVSAQPSADCLLLYERLQIIFFGHPIGEVFRLAVKELRQAGGGTSRKPARE